MAAPNLSTADAMQATLSHYSAPSSSPVDMRASLNHIRPQIGAINLMLDRVALQPGNSDAVPPLLLRLVKPGHITKELAAMINFATSPWQSSFNWRDCAVHKSILAQLDLANPKQALHKMLGGSKGHERPAQATHTNRFHPYIVDGGNRQWSRPPTSQSPVQRGHPGALPTPTPSPKSGSAQEYLQHSRPNMLDGHMPQLTSQADPAARNHPTTNGSSRTSIAAPATTNNHGGMQPFGATDMYSRFYGGQITAPGGQVQHNKGQVVPSDPRQPTQQQFQRQPTQAPLNPNTTPPQVQPQQRINTVKPSVEAATTQSQDGQQLPKLYLPSNFSSPYSRQYNPQARLRAEQLTAERTEQPQAQGIKITSSPGKKDAASKRSPKIGNTCENTTSVLQASQTPVYKAPEPKPVYKAPEPKPVKTPEQIEYERKLAAYEAWKFEKDRQDRLKAERKAKLKEELDAEMRIHGNDVLAYRYRDYMEIYPCAPGMRTSTYHLRLLANQAIEDNDRSEEAMAVRYAKEKWWNFWAVGDRKMVVELLREKKKTSEHALSANMKAGGYLITNADIEAIRKMVGPEGTSRIRIGTFDEWKARRL